MVKYGTVLLITTMTTELTIEEQNEDDACITHYTVGKTVHKAIKELGGTMPEDLPTPQKSLIQLEKENKKKLKKIEKE